jgi:uncharacterized protein (DUF58 family)
MKRAAGVLGAGVLLTLASFTFDAAPLFVPAVAFTLIGGVTPLWVWASARGAVVSRRLATERALEGEPVQARIAIRGGRLGLPGAQVLDPLAGAPVSVRQPLSPLRGSVAEVPVLTRFGRRGLHRLPAPTLIVRDLLALARVERPGDGGSQQLLILPRTERVRWRAQERGARALGGGPDAGGEPPASVDVDGLRPYRPGTPASRIHWPGLARGAGLLERRLAPDGDTRPSVVLDARGNGPIEHLDAAVRAAASLTLELARRGGCRLLLPGERRAVAIEPDLLSWPAAHARLALVDGAGAARAPILGPGTRLGSVFYVAAASPERLPAMLTTPGSGAALLVLPAELRLSRKLPARFEVAGCRGYALGVGRTAAGDRAA